MTPFIFATTFAEYSDVLCVRVVGGGECGKSTIVKQMKYVHSLSSAVFSKRQRITLRLLYAIGRPSVVCLSVCLSSVCRLWRWCTLLRRLNFSAIFFHHTIAQGLYFSGAKIRWWGTPLSPWNLRSKWRTPSENVDFQSFRFVALRQ